MSLVGADVDELRTELGIEDGLAAVQAAVAGEEIAQGAGHGKIRRTGGAEQLHACLLYTSDAADT